MGGDVVVTVMTGGSAASGAHVDGRPGDVIVLGSCACDECNADVLLDARPGAWFRARITVMQDHWRLDNLSPDADAWLIDLEQPELRTCAPHGRRGLLVPFEIADLSWRVGSYEASEHATVIGPEQTTTRVPAACRRSSRDWAVDLRPGSTGRAVLAVMRAGVLRSGRTPSSAAVAEELSRRGQPVTPRTVDRTVDHLYERCFPQAEAQARGWKRRALVSLLLREGGDALLHDRTTRQGWTAPLCPVPRPSSGTTASRLVSTEPKPSARQREDR